MELNYYKYEIYITVILMQIKSFPIVGKSKKICVELVLRRSITLW